MPAAALPSVNAMRAERLYSCMLLILNLAEPRSVAHKPRLTAWTLRLDVWPIVACVLVTACDLSLTWCQGSGVRKRDLSEGVRRAICLSSCAKRSLSAVSSCCLPHESGGRLTSSVTPKTGRFELGAEMGAEMGAELVGASSQEVMDCSQASVGLVDPCWSNHVGRAMIAGPLRWNLAVSEWVSPCSASCAEIARSSRLSSSRRCRNTSSPHSPSFMKAPNSPALRWPELSVSSASQSARSRSSGIARSGSLSTSRTICSNSS